VDVKPVLLYEDSNKQQLINLENLLAKNKELAINVLNPSI
jgi:hypothetical protein